MPEDLTYWAAVMVEQMPKKAASHLKYYSHEQRIAILKALHQVERCVNCGRKLTDPVSLERGMGSDCYGKQMQEATNDRT